MGQKLFAGIFYRRDLLTRTAVLSVTGACAAPENSDFLSRTQTSGPTWNGGGRIRFVASPNDAALAGLTWRGDGKRLAVRSSYGQGVVLDGNGSIVNRLPEPQSSGVDQAILYALDGQTLLLGGSLRGRPQYSNTAITLVEADTGRPLRELPGLNPRSARIPPIGGSARTLRYDRQAQAYVALLVHLPKAFVAYSVATLEPYIFGPQVFHGPSFELQENGQDLATSRGSSDVFVYDRQSGREKCNRSIDPNRVTSLAFSPDGSLLLVTQNIARFRGPYSDEEQEARRHLVVGWRTSDYSQVRVTNHFTEAPTRACFHPDSSIFAVFNRGQVLFFETAGFTLIGSVRTSIQLATVMQFSPDGGSLAVGGSSAGVTVIST